MDKLNRFETTEFLETFLEGLLTVGLLEPLQKLESSGTPKVKRAASSIYKFLVAGLTPQVAACLMEPRFPSTIESLFVCGFEQSNIDFVLKDILQVYRSHQDDGELNNNLIKLLDHYSPLKTEFICNECWTQEIRKILSRARAEKAKQVILSYQGGHNVQKFISVKLVTITEPAIPAVYSTIRQAFLDLAKQAQKNSLNLEVRMLSNLQFQASSDNQMLQVTFAD